MKQMLLVEEPNEDVKVFEPLASRMRPRDLEEYAGQRHLLAKGKLLRNLIESDNIPSMILWGPPGWGRPLWPAS